MGRDRRLSLAVLATLLWLRPQRCAAAEPISGPSTFEFNAIPDPHSAPPSAATGDAKASPPSRVAQSVAAKPFEFNAISGGAASTEPVTAKAFEFNAIPEPYSAPVVGGARDTIGPVAVKVRVHDTVNQSLSRPPEVASRMTISSPQAAKNTVPAAEYLDNTDLTLASPATGDKQAATTEPAGADDEFAAAASPLELHPLGYSGRSPISPLHLPDDDFLPVPDRWRIGLPGQYAQNEGGSLVDPYHQNVLKGDYPIIGQDKFLVLSLTSDTLIEARRLPTPSGVSAAQGNRLGFFGNGDSVFVNEDAIFSIDFFQGDAGYKPRDFDLKATIVANGNFLHANERGVVSPDPRDGTDRADDHVGVQELFVEKKLTDLSSNYDFLSLRAGIQDFNNDFKGFLFSDQEPGLRLFGNYDDNRYQFNLAWFNQLEKDTNSGLNTFQTRDQNVFFANLFRQDFLFPGYTAELSGAANIDHGTDRVFDTNGFLVRPAPIGAIESKKLDAYYIGLGGDGHIGRWNITHQFYEVFGREDFNPIADRSTTINGQFVALELSYDEDYIRYRASFAYASGDHNPQGKQATGFDSIFDDPNFAGGDFSYFTRQAIPLTGTGVNLVNRDSFLPDLRTSKEEGQANFVNPGLFIYNLGMDVDVTPKIKLITNASYLRFDTTAPLQRVLQDERIGRDIGVDLSLGVQYRPLLNNNVVIDVGAAALLPGSGFTNIYGSDVLYSSFCALTLRY
jgi:hypothetical protein